MDGVASDASFANSLMLKYERSLLIFVAFEAGLVDILERRG
jgi:hypothetical protein